MLPILFALLSILFASPCLAEPTSFPALAPGYTALPYPPPKPGSYRLPAMGSAAAGKVLDTDGKALNLHDILGDKLVLLSFIYASCDDVNGCPLATAVFQKIKTKLKTKPKLADKLRLITLSFNPEHDTPEVMAHYAQGFKDAGIDWRFLTTAAQSDIKPILKSYGQSVKNEFNEKGQPTGKYSHLLRVLLIDRNKQIRNIYTVSVLHPDTVIADIETLLTEADKPTALSVPEKANDKTALLRPGDDKTGYESSAYQTHSIALPQRIGKPADLLKLASNPAWGLPKVPVPADNPLSRKKVALGRKLFFDRRLSLNNTFSCAMCHIPEQGFTSREQATAIGIEGRTVRRNSPTLYNVGYAEKLFHDGRESSLENQVWGPFLARNEMGNPSVGFVVDKLKRLPDYQGLFAQAFHRPASMETVGQAIAGYERTLVSGNSRFDRWRYRKQADALSPLETQGFALFNGKAGCSQCHTIGERYALFTDQKLHNTGVGFRDSMGRPGATQKVQLAPGLSVDLDSSAIGRVSEAKPSDLGLYEITQNPADRWKYKTPTLRNIALTAPYMHNGSFSTLAEVVAFYNRGGEVNENLDPLIKPLGLSSGESDALVAFLLALTGDAEETLVLDAYAAPVGNE